MKTLIIFIFYFVFSVSVLAHSWFPLECCGKGDCKEIIEWKMEGNNWIIKTSELTVVVPTTFPLRLSQDSKRYLCASPITRNVYCIFSLLEI